MSGKISVCSTCGGEYHSEIRQVGKYPMWAGWCPECNRPVVEIPIEALDDDECVWESEAHDIARKIHDEHYKPFKIVDSPEFQFKQTTKPDEYRYCSSCVHGYCKIEDGEDKGQACRLHPEYGSRFNVHVIEDCKEYEPRDTWLNMGSECRNCYWSYMDGSMRCKLLSIPLNEVSDYDKGHCGAYEYSTYWAFDKAGFTECPECKGWAIKTKRGYIRCRCGYKGEWKDE